MKYSKYVFTGALLFAASSASAQLLTTYAGIDYDMNEAYRVAKYNAPKVDCIFTNTPGTFPMPWEQQCFDSAVIKIAFINPRTQKAYKFSVQSIAQEHGDDYVEIKQLSFSTIESEAVNEFYKIHADIKNAVSRLNLINPSFQTNGLSFSNSAGQFSATSSSSQCDNHPMSYFVPRGAKATHQMLNNDIAKELGNRDWYDYFVDTDFSGGGIQIGKENFGLNISLSHTNLDVYTSVNYGSEDNVLVFKVNYRGDFRKNGERKLRLSFDLDRSSSVVDGIGLWRLFTNDPNIVFDLSKTPVSNCLIDFIKEEGTSVPNPDGGGSNVGGLPGTGGVPGGSAMCTETVRAYTCSTTQDGKTQCAQQVFAFPATC